ncbi:MAG: glycosyltransferase family 39 protein [Bacteroidetes bacterium]|nr:MAG: glycosyltransferase family 39 protein [Bacteroidota bacterium]
MRIPKDATRDLWLFGLIAAAAFFPFLGAAPLFDWDEINFAESAREMMATGNYFRVQVNYEPFWEKPPLFFWLQVLAMRLFGVGEYAARFPNALIGVATVLALYLEGRHWRDRSFGRLLAMLYLATFLPVIYFKSGIIDPVFNFFIFLGIMQVLRHDQQWQTDPAAARADNAPWAAGFWIGLATLTKGPVALLVAMLTYSIYKAIWGRFRLPWWGVARFFLAWMILVLGWYGLETVVHGPWFIEQFIAYQVELFSKDVAGHAQPFYYHLLVFLPGCFPMSAFVFRAMAEKPAAGKDQALHRFMLLWFWVVMVLFSVVRTKIVHYGSLLYFPAVFLAGMYLHRLIRERDRLRWDAWALLGLGLLVWGLIPSLLNWVTAHREALAARLSDPLAAASLRVEVAWTGWEWLIGAAFLLGGLWGLRLLAQRRYVPFLWLQLVLTLLFVNAQYRITLPKVAQHTQGAPLEFFSGLADQPAYVLTLGYKSYLPYFYARVRPGGDAQAADKDWLIQGDPDRPVYLSVPAHKLNPALRSRIQAFERLYEAGGFVFFRRPAQRVNRAGRETPGLPLGFK